MGNVKLARGKVPPRKALIRALGFLHEVELLLIEKNAEYGDSISNPVRIFSSSTEDEQLRARLDDKLSRIRMTGGIKSSDEDTVKDLCGYLAFFATKTKEKKR